MNIVFKNINFWGLQNFVNNCFCLGNHIYYRYSAKLVVIKQVSSIKILKYKENVLAHSFLAFIILNLQFFLLFWGFDVFLSMSLKIGMCCVFRYDVYLRILSVLIV